MIDDDNRIEPPLLTLAEISDALTKFLDTVSYYPWVKRAEAAEARVKELKRKLQFIEDTANGTIKVPHG